ncbi:MAG: PQQ-binding-like beta-propeller repeat protein [Thermoplasmata archaeon]|nr:MAG: PQQ-binding-like beta-propeller repeat protein [Thermoplasmata archaeon]
MIKSFSEYRSYYVIVFITTVCFMLTTTFSVITQSVSAYENWPMHMNTPTHSGQTENTAPYNTDIEWTYDTGEMRLYASPVVYEGVVYVLGPSFYALDAGTGALQWSYPIEAAQDFTPSDKPNWHYWSEWSTPAVSGDRIYIVTSLDNAIIALDRTPKDGVDEGYTDPEGAVYDIIWKYEISTENIFGSRSSPIVIDDTVFVGTAEGDLVALAADPKDDSGAITGVPELKWSYRIGTRIDSSPAYFEDMIFIGTWDIRNRPAAYQFNASDTYFYAFDSTPGSDGIDEGLPDPEGANYDVIWRAKLGDLIWSSPTVDPETGTVYIGCTDRHLYAFNYATGTQLWNHTVGGPIYGTPALHNDKIVFGTTEPDNSLYALNAKTGERIWKFQAGEKVAASPIISGNRVYSAIMNGRLHSLDIGGSGDGNTSTIWTVELPDRLRGTPAIAEGHLYASCWDGNLYCLGNVPDVELEITEFSVTGDSEELLIKFGIGNNGEDTVVNGTAYLYDDRTLIHEEELEAFAQGTTFIISYTGTDFEAGRHIFRIRAVYYDEMGKQYVLRSNFNATIEKHEVASFIPALWGGTVIIMLVAAAVITKFVFLRRLKENE